MKTLLLIRHAKSSWAEAGLKDIDRPLNERGRKEAPMMAKRLRERGINVDLFVSSPAKRARSTAKLFAEEYDVKKDEILFAEDLYFATQDSFRNTVAGLKGKADTVALFSHNPGITEFANSLANVHIDDMPTCSIFAVQADTDKWESFEVAEKNFLFFDYPKNPMF
jgi:phosphohistidine phosphatase